MRVQKLPLVQVARSPTEREAHNGNVTFSKTLPAAKSAFIHVGNPSALVANSPPPPFFSIPNTGSFSGIVFWRVFRFSVCLFFTGRILRFRQVRRLWRLVTCLSLRFWQAYYSAGVTDYYLPESTILASMLVSWFVCLSVCLFVCAHSSTHSFAPFSTKLFVQVRGRHGTAPHTFDRDTSNIRVRKKFVKLEKSLSLTWADISKIHNFAKSNDNGFQF